MNRPHPIAVAELSDALHYALNNKPRDVDVQTYHFVRGLSAGIDWVLGLPTGASPEYTKELLDIFRSRT